MVYQKQIGLALAGIAISSVPSLLSVVPQIKTYAEAQRLKAQEELQRQRIAERAKTSEELYKAGVAPSARVLRIRRYIDNPNRDPKPDTTGFGAGEFVHVYDSTGACIGKIEQNQWYWIHKYNNACN